MNLARDTRTRISQIIKQDTFVIRDKLPIIVYDWYFFNITIIFNTLLYRNFGNKKILIFHNILNESVNWNQQFLR